MKTPSASWPPRSTVVLVDQIAPLEEASLRYARLRAAGFTPRAALASGAPVPEPRGLAKTKGGVR